MVDIMPNSQRQPAREHSHGMQGLSGPGLRAFFRIMDSWQVAEPARMHILGATRSTYFRWKRDPDLARMPRDTLERISYVLGIYKALQIHLPDPGAADRWVNQTNQHPVFAGQTPLQRMSGGQVADLYVVRQHLDAERGWS
jgi:hypothetical protein